jgi:hypothetical protein
LRAIASRLVMPEFMLTSDASNANYASTMVAEGPAMRMFDRMQQDMIEEDLGVMAHVVQAAIAAERLPPDTLELLDIQAVAPTLAVRDRLQDAQADQILVRNQAMSVETMAARHGLSPDHEQQLISRRADVREANFNPNEPRDERGRWTPGGSDDGPTDPGRARRRGRLAGMGVALKGGPSASGGSAARGGAYSPEEAKKLFDKEKARSDIAFKYPSDGCYARAHLMAEDIKKAGGEPGKVWAFPKNPTDPLHANTKHDPAGHVEWGYHVAPTVPVKGKDGKEKNMVIDPSLFDKPVTSGAFARSIKSRILGCKALCRASGCKALCLTKRDSRGGAKRGARRSSTSCMQIEVAAWALAAMENSGLERVPQLRR